MGSYSDVALAIKKEAWESLPEKIQAFTLDCFDDTTDVSESGARLFHVTDIKWRPTYDVELGEFEKALEKLDGDDYLLIVAHHDYPESEADDSGWWNDNPWNIYKFTTVGINYT